MLAFYWAYFLPSTGMSSGMRKALYGITAFVCASYMAILWDDTFFCGKDVSVQWSQEEGACSVFYAPEPFILNFTLNLACYLAGMLTFPSVRHASPDTDRISSLRPPSHPAGPGCSSALQGCHCYFRAWSSDHLHYHCAICHSQGWHWPRESCL